MPEIAGNAAVLVNPLQLDEISASLEKIIQDSDFRDQLIKLGFENAKKYSWDNSGEKLIDLFTMLSKK